jgi:hypothetical protein
MFPTRPLQRVLPMLVPVALVSMGSSAHAASDMATRVAAARTEHGLSVRASLNFVVEIPAWAELRIDASGGRVRGASNATQRSSSDAASHTQRDTTAQGQTRWTFSMP